tara:strand:+ start:188 stop:718 length:531 start_codon:yes stop_codon:yes gene_type:complete
MNKIKEFYNKIVSLNKEYENILELDKLYMEMFLKDNQNILNNNTDNDIDFINNSMNDEIQDCKNMFKDRKCIKLYRKLAKILHPDKNEKHKDLFIKMNKAYNNNEYIILFMYGYEFNIIDTLNEEEIITINQEIEKKQKLIEDIVNKIHWKWVNCNNNIEKELLKTHIVNNLNQHF